MPPASDKQQRKPGYITGAHLRPFPQIPFPKVDKDIPLKHPVDSASSAHERRPAKRPRGEPQIERIVKKSKDGVLYETYEFVNPDDPKKEPLTTKPVPNRYYPIPFHKRWKGGPTHTINAPYDELSAHNVFAYEPWKETEQAEIRPGEKVSEGDRDVVNVVPPLPFFGDLREPALDATLQLQRNDPELLVHKQLLSRDTAGDAFAYAKASAGKVDPVFEKQQLWVEALKKLGEDKKRELIDGADYGETQKIMRALFDDWRQLTLRFESMKYCGPDDTEKGPNVEPTLDISDAKNSFIKRVDEFVDKIENSEAFKIAEGERARLKKMTKDEFTRQQENEDLVRMTILKRMHDIKGELDSYRFEHNILHKDMIGDTPEDLKAKDIKRESLRRQFEEAEKRYNKTSQEYAKIINPEEHKVDWDAAVKNLPNLDLSTKNPALRGASKTVPTNSRTSVSSLKKSKRSITTSGPLRSEPITLEVVDSIVNLMEHFGIASTVLDDDYETAFGRLDFDLSGRVPKLDYIETTILFSNFAEIIHRMGQRMQQQAQILGAEVLTEQNRLDVESNQGIGKLREIPKLKPSILPAVPQHSPVKKPHSLPTTEFDIASSPSEDEMDIDDEDEKSRSTSIIEEKGNNAEEEKDTKGEVEENKRNECVDDEGENEESSGSGSIEMGLFAPPDMPDYTPTPTTRPHGNSRSTSRFVPSGISPLKYRPSLLFTRRSEQWKPAVFSPTKLTTAEEKEFEELFGKPSRKRVPQLKGRKSDVHEGEDNGYNNQENEGDEGSEGNGEYEAVGESEETSEYQPSESSENSSEDQLSSGESESSDEGEDEDEREDGGEDDKMS